MKVNVGLSTGSIGSHQPRFSVREDLFEVGNLSAVAMFMITKAEECIVFIVSKFSLKFMLDSN